MTATVKHVIAGEETTANTTDTQPIVNPATGEEIGTLPSATPRPSTRLSRSP